MYSKCALNLHLICTKKVQIGLRIGWFSKMKKISYTAFKLYIKIYKQQINRQKSGFDTQITPFTISFTPEIQRKETNPDGQIFNAKI